MTNLPNNNDLKYNSIGEENLNFIVTYNQLCEGSVEDAVKALNAIDEQVTAIINANGGCTEELACSLKIFYMYFFTYCTTRELINALEEECPYGMPRCLMIAMGLISREIADYSEKLSPVQSINADRLIDYIMFITKTSDSILLSFCYIDNPEMTDQITMSKDSMKTVESWTAMEGLITSQVLLMFLMNASLIISSIENGRMVKTSFLSSNGDILSIPAKELETIVEEGVACREATCSFVTDEDVFRQCDKEPEGKIIKFTSATKETKVKKEEETK